MSGNFQQSYLSVIYLIILMLFYILMWTVALTFIFQFLTVGRNTVVIESLRRIEAGEEIIVSYGNELFLNAGMNFANARVVRCIAERLVYIKFLKNLRKAVQGMRTLVLVNRISSCVLAYLWGKAIQFGDSIAVLSYSWCYNTAKYPVLFWCHHNSHC